jgi:hypothetical protein
VAESRGRERHSVGDRANGESAGEVSCDLDDGFVDALVELPPPGVGGVEPEQGPL